MVSRFRASSSSRSSFRTSSARRVIRSSRPFFSVCRRSPSTRAFSSRTRSRAGSKAFSTEKAGSRRPLGSNISRLSVMGRISSPSRAGMAA